ncbi:MAG: hypothetical protein QG673_1765 [Pseudomonadota bacterium]|nr:hypothetical protein [Pseudomonadota bacterium]
MKKIINTILWDLDGTLINSEHISNQSGILAAKLLGYTYTGDDIPPGIANQHGFELVFKQKPAENPDLFNRWKKMTDTNILQELNSTQQINQSVKLFEYFHQLGLLQSVVSNSPSGIIKHSLQQLRLATKCHSFFGSDQVEHGKPHPQLYLNAILHHNTTANQCLCFEDSYVGITAARAAGLSVIGIGKNSQDYAPDLVLMLEDNDWLPQLLNHYEFKPQQ